MHSSRRFFLVLLTVVVGIAVPWSLKPSGAVLAVVWSIIGLALLGIFVTWEPVARRLPLMRHRLPSDRELPERNDRRDLADDLDAFANRMADWLDARDVQAPHIIDQNTAAILGRRTLGEILRIAQDDPERWEAHWEASAHYDRTTRAEYIMGRRSDALALFDQAMESAVVTPKIRERFEKPDMIQLRALPDVLRKLAQRLRVQAADRLLSQLTVGHFPSPMRPQRHNRAA